MEVRNFHNMEIRNLTATECEKREREWFETAFPKWTQFSNECADRIIKTMKDLAKKG